MKLQKPAVASPRKPYPTDLTDAQWQLIQPLIPPEKPGGRSRTIESREIINAIIYILKSGCDWRMLPHDLPNWKIVYHYFQRWEKDGTWKKLHDVLRGKVRKRSGKKAKPTAAILDSQSVKTAKKGDFVAMTLGRR